MNSNAGRGFLKAVLIVGFLFAILYFISYNNWASHDFNKVDITYNLNNDMESSNIEIDNKTDNKTKEYSDLYSRINYEFLEYNFGEEFYDIYYKNKALTDEYIIVLGITNIIKSDSVVNCNYETKISKDDLKKEIISLIGNVSYTDKSFTTKNGYLSINYDSNTLEYTVKLNGKCSGFDFSSGGIKNIYHKAEIDGNYLYIYEKALYLENTKDSKNNIIFSYHEDIDKDSKVIAKSFNDVNVELLPTYIYEFKKINDSYTLQKITRK